MKMITKDAKPMACFSPPMKMERQMKLAGPFAFVQIVQITRACAILRTAVQDVLRLCAFPPTIAMAMEFRTARITVRAWPIQPKRMQMGMGLEMLAMDHHQVAEEVTDDET